MYNVLHFRYLYIHTPGEKKEKKEKNYKFVILIEHQGEPMVVKVGISMREHTYETIITFKPKHMSKSEWMETLMMRQLEQMIAQNAVSATSPARFELDMSDELQLQHAPLHVDCPNHRVPLHACRTCSYGITGIVTT